MGRVLVATVLCLCEVSEETLKSSREGSSACPSGAGSNPTLSAAGAE